MDNHFRLVEPDDFKVAWIGEADIETPERSEVRLLANGTLIVNPADRAELTVRKTVAEDGSLDLTVISELTAREEIREYLSHRNARKARELVDDLEAEQEARDFDLTTKNSEILSDFLTKVKARA